jgi:hypothetical protein
VKLQEAVASVLRRLDDEDGTVWTNDEIALYVKDGYDKFCRMARVLFDMHVIENIPQAGNWSTDLELYQAEHTPGMGITDNPLHYTADHERNQSLTGQVGGSTEGPVNITSPADGPLLDDFDIPSKVATGRLPDSTVDVDRVTWDELELLPEDSAVLRHIDSQYERRDGGDPRQFAFDKDGLLNLRLIPPALADAEYATVNGSWGTMTQTSSTTVTVVGSYGILRDVDGAFPAGGPHGTPTRQHPASRNIVVELFRLGRSLDAHSFEISQASVKYCIFWAMHRALKKDGPGQDLKLAKHYGERFTMGVARAKVQLRTVQKELILRMGSGGQPEPTFGLGEPQLPYPYGPRGRKI